MNRLKKVLVHLALIAFPAYAMSSDSTVAIDADGMRINANELSYALARVNRDTRVAVASDTAARYSFIAGMFAAKRMEVTAEQLDPATDHYWSVVFARRAATRKWLEKDFVETLTIPDIEELARESFRADFNGRASEPERRTVSHILIRCRYACDDPRTQAKVDVVQKRLLDGEVFEDLVVEFSDDFASIATGGALSVAFSESDSRLDPEFSAAAFELNAIGDVSPPTLSQFGWHFIRLVSIQPERELAYEDVAETLKAAVVDRYRSDKLREFIDTFGPSDGLKIDDEILEAIIADSLAKK